jgi:hypothetical protein
MHKIPFENNSSILLLDTCDTRQLSKMHKNRATEATQDLIWSVLANAGLQRSWITQQVPLSLVFGRTSATASFRNWVKVHDHSATRLCVRSLREIHLIPDELDKLITYFLGNLKKYQSSYMNTVMQVSMLRSSSWTHMTHRKRDLTL